MHVDFAISFSRLLNELNCIIENAFNLLPHMILKMVLLVADMLIKVVGTVISSTVYDVRDAIGLQNVFILLIKSLPRYRKPSMTSEHIRL